MKKLALTTALALAALAGPAAAKDHPDHGNKAHAQAEHGQSQQGKARRCTAHGAAYVVGGTLDSGTLTANPDGTYDGTLTVKVAQANHHARADRTTSRAYTLDHARVNLHGQDPAALKPGSRVKLQGKVTKLNRKCDQSAFTATTTIRRASIKDPKAAATEDKSSATETETEKPAETETPASS
jgi:hypothetical protein